MSRRLLSCALAASLSLGTVVAAPAENLPTAVAADASSAQAQAGTDKASSEMKGSSYVSFLDDSVEAKDQASKNAGMLALDWALGIVGFIVVGGILAFVGQAINGR